MPDTSFNAWIIVSSPDNWQKTIDRDFTIHGFKSRQRKKAEQMRPGDKIISYITGQKVFGGVLTITSEYFEEHDNPIWTSDGKKSGGEDYPFRVKVEKDSWLDEANRVDAQSLAREMEYTKRWPEKNWTLAFQGNVHLISAADYNLIREAIDTAGR